MNLYCAICDAEKDTPHDLQKHIDAGSLDTRTVIGGDVVEPATLDLGEARGMVIGPDDRLVIVMPGRLTPYDLQAHANRIKEAIGNRFVIVAGDDIRLAKVNADDWDRPALGR